MRYYMGPDKTKDCRYWDDAKKEAYGCGIDCTCPGRIDRLTQYHKYSDMLKLFENDRKQLEDIWDEDWYVIQAMILEREAYKLKKEEEAKRIQELLDKQGQNSKRL